MFPNKLRSLAPLPVVELDERRRNLMSWKIRNPMTGGVEGRCATNGKYMRDGRK